MTPLGTTALGLALVLADFRLQGLDVLADPLGWVVAVAGLSRLASRDRCLAWSVGIGIAAGVLSVADVVHPVVTVDGTSREVDPSGLQGVMSDLAALLSLVVALLLSLAIRELARRHGDAALARRFTGFAVFHAAAGAVLSLVGSALLLLSEPVPLVNGTLLAPVVLLLVLVFLAVEVWFLASLARAGQRTWLGGRLEPVP